MKVARETPTFIYADSRDMTGFADGTNPNRCSALLTPIPRLLTADAF